MYKLLPLIPLLTVNKCQSSRTSENTKIKNNPSANLTGEDGTFVGGWVILYWRANKARPSHSGGRACLLGSVDLPVKLLKAQ